MTEAGFRCPYRTEPPLTLSQCPAGFPGCACGDDILAEDGPGWDAWRASCESP